MCVCFVSLHVAVATGSACDSDYLPLAVRSCVCATSTVYGHCSRSVYHWHWQYQLKVPVRWWLLPIYIHCKYRYKTKHKNQVIMLQVPAASWAPLTAAPQLGFPPIKPPARTSTSMRPTAAFSNSTSCSRFRQNLLTACQEPTLRKT